MQVILNFPKKKQKQSKHMPGIKPIIHYHTDTQGRVCMKTSVLLLLSSSITCFPSEQEK